MSLRTDQDAWGLTSDPAMDFSICKLFQGMHGLYFFSLSFIQVLSRYVLGESYFTLLNKDQAKPSCIINVNIYVLLPYVCVINCVLQIFPSLACSFNAQYLPLFLKSSKRFVLLLPIPFTSVICPSMT